MAGQEVGATHPPGQRSPVTAWTPPAVAAASPRGASGATQQSSSLAPAAPAPLRAASVCSLASPAGSKPRAWGVLQQTHLEGGARASAARLLRGGIVGGGSSSFASPATSRVATKSYRARSQQAVRPRPRVSEFSFSQQDRPAAWRHERQPAPRPPPPHAADKIVFRPLKELGPRCRGPSRGCAAQRRAAATPSAAHTPERRPPNPLRLTYNAERL